MEATTKRFKLTRLFLGLVLLALGACAAVGIFVLLFGRSGDEEIRILATCAAAAYGSLTGLGCAVPLDRDLWKKLAITGIAVSICATVSLVLGIWTDFFESEEYGKATFIVCLFAGALSHTSLLWLANLRASYAWTRYATTLTTFVFVISLSVAVVVEELDDDVLRILGALSILAALGTLAVPILHRMSRAPPEDLHKKPQAEEVELFCPRCQRRQKVFVGSAHCMACGLEIHIELAGWNEPAET